MQFNRGKMNINIYSYPDILYNYRAMLAIENNYIFNTIP